MELRVLRYFLTAAREESISGAAAFLNVTQPTLSRQLIELEEELGAKLFIRGSRKITLTDEGLLLRKRAEEIITLAERTEAEFHAPDENISGDIYIGGGETDAMRLIAIVAKEMRERYPNVRFHLYSGNADDVTERLDKGLLDFGILIEPADIRKYDFLSLPATDTWGLLMRKDSPLASRETIRSEDIWDIPLICSRQSQVDNEMAGWIGRNFETLHVVATYNLVFNASLMVSEGVGYALCLDKLVNTSENSDLCFRPLEPMLEARLDIVWKKYQVSSKATTKFLEMVRDSILLAQQANKK